MKTFNARVAIYCDVEIEVDDSFDYDNYDDGALLEQALGNTPEPYDTRAGRIVEAAGYEVISIWDDEQNKCLYAG